MPRVLFRNSNDPDLMDQEEPGIAEWPREYVDTSEIQPTGSTIVVNAGGNLQAAIDAAVFGDQITIEAGATFTGPFTLPDKSGSGWVIIRTSTPDANLPPFGTRITPASAGLLPKLATATTEPAITTDTAAHHYRFIGIEFCQTVGNTYTYNLVVLSAPVQASLSQVPHHFVFDRCYAHGSPAAGLRRAFYLQSAHTALINSYVSDCHEIGGDAQAVLGTNSPGPIKIVNNFLEGAAENVIFGGADPQIANLVVSDIEIKRNHFYKPLTWKENDPSYAGTLWQVKNLFELKNAQRVIVDGNVFEHNWDQAQNGFAILFTVRNQEGTAPWSVVQDVTFTNNIVRHVSSVFNILGEDDLQPSQITKRILIQNNLFEDVSSVAWGAYGRQIQMLRGASDVHLNHNTVLHDGDVITAEGEPNAGFVYTNNLSQHNVYGVGGAGTYGNPLLTLSTFFPGVVFAGNILSGGNAGDYPPGNYFPADLAAVQFVNLAGGDYHLSGSSPYNNAGTDGQDIGADIDVLNAAVAGVV